MSGPESVEERQARLGRNEALFRAVNERINELNELFEVVPDEALEVVCECGDAACFERMLIQTAEYARVRADPTLFILVPGHEDATVKTVVDDDRDTGYLVARNQPGGPADLAAKEVPDS